MSGQLGTIPYPVWQDDSGGTSAPQSGSLSLNVTQSDPVPTTWAPSPWRSGMPPTAGSVNTSQYPMPTQDQIEAQRQAIYGRLRQYGYPPQQLSDPQVLSTMSNLPQQPVQWPQWVQDWNVRNPGHMDLGARPGVDVPTNPTYEDYNLRNRGLGGSPTQVGYGYAIPREALIDRYGQAWMDDQDRQWMVEHSTPGATLRLVDPTHPGGYDVRVPGTLPSWMTNPQAAAGGGRTAPTAPATTARAPPPAQQAQAKSAAPNPFAAWDQWYQQYTRTPPPQTQVAQAPPPTQPLMQPVAAPGTTAAISPMQYMMRPSISTEAASSYSTADADHERTAQRYRDMLSA